MRMRNFASAAIMAATMAVAAGAANPAAAEDAYPSHAVTVIIPFNAGGGGDPVARYLFEAIGKKLGQRFILDFRPGGGATIGARAVAQAAPDGYTMMWTTQAPLVSANFMPGGAPYDPVKDFIIVTEMIYTPNFITANAATPYNTIDEFIDYAKAHPDKVNVGVAGIGGTSHAALAMIEYKTGTKFNVVPYSGTGGVLPDLISGAVDISLATPTAYLGGVQSGRLKYLGVMSPSRSTVLPNVPSTDESKYKGLYYLSYYTLSVPKGTPKAIVDKLNAVSTEILKSPEVTKKMNEFGFDVAASTPEEAAALVREDVANMKGMIDAGIFKVE